MVRSLDSLVICQVLRRRLRARISGREAEADGDREIPGFLDQVLSVVDPHIGGAVEAGPLDKSVGVWARLNEPCFCLRAEACFPSSFVDDVCRYVLFAVPFQSSAHGQTAAWSQKRSRSWPCKEHCVSRARECGGSVVRHGGTTAPDAESYGHHVCKKHGRAYHMSFFLCRARDQWVALRCLPQSTTVS